MPRLKSAPDLGWKSALFDWLILELGRLADNPTGRGHRVNLQLTRSPRQDVPLTGGLTAIKQGEEKIRKYRSVRNAHALHPWAIGAAV
jgi:hypothetical protein